MNIKEALWPKARASIESRPSHGLLKNVVYKNLKQEDGIAQFVVEVEQIAFLGGASNEAADAVTIPNKLDGERPFLSFQTSRVCSIEL